MPAIAHQNKILGNTSGGGSTILVTTSESTLYGQTVTLSDGTTTLTGTFSNAGECEFTGVMMVGTLTATSGTASTSINVPYFGVYSIILSLFSATITATFPSGATCTCVGNGETYTASTSPHTFTVHGAATYRVTATIDGQSKYDDVVISTDGQTASITIEYGTINVTYDNAFRGASITCVQGGTTITKTAPSGANTMTFYPPTTGSWVISGTVGGTPYSKTANVTSLSTSVSVSLETVPDGKTTTPTDDIEKWLQCGQITGKSYTTLSQVLADAETYERLLSDSNACDYMKRSTTWASTICADADAMMRLGKYDYACDALLADSTWCTAICGSTYFEYVLTYERGLVPVMTSNTTPSGECFGSAYESTGNYYLAFDNDSATMWSSGERSPNYSYVGYSFSSSKKVRIAVITNRLGIGATWKIQGSSDKSSWSDLTSDVTFNAGETKAIVLTTEGNVQHYRVYGKCTSNDWTNQLLSVQFYDRYEPQTDIIVTAHGGDTVYYMENGSPVTLTTADSDTGIGTVDWSDLPKGAITLYSSTAKNPSDLTADYSKTVYVTEYTTQIYLMPDNALYWWGCIGDIEDITSANGWTSPNPSYQPNMVAPQYYTNYIDTYDATNVLKGIGTKHIKSDVSKIQVICKQSPNAQSNAKGSMGTITSKSNGSLAGINIPVSLDIQKTEYQVPTTGNYYPIIFGGSATGNYIYAFLYE